MEAVFLLIPLAILIVFIALAFFLWAISNGQYDDLDSPAHRILFDENHPKSTHLTTNKDNNK